MRDDRGRKTVTSCVDKGLGPCDRRLDVTAVSAGSPYLLVMAASCTPAAICSDGREWRRIVLNHGSHHHGLRRRSRCDNHGLLLNRRFQSFFYDRGNGFGFRCWFLDLRLRRRTQGASGSLRPPHRNSTHHNQTDDEQYGHHLSAFDEPPPPKLNRTLGCQHE